MKEQRLINWLIFLAVLLCAFFIGAIGCGYG
jgi:hypothetical protein